MQAFIRFSKEEKLRQGQRELEAQRAERLSDSRVQEQRLVSRWPLGLHRAAVRRPKLQDEHERSLKHVIPTHSETACRVESRDEAKHCRPSRASSARVQAAHRPSEVQIARLDMSCIGFLRNTAASREAVSHSWHDPAARRGRGASTGRPFYAVLCGSLRLSFDVALM